MLKNRLKCLKTVKKPSKLPRNLEKQRKMSKNSLNYRKTVTKPLKMSKKSKTAINV